ncbi:MAG: hypothetical protein IKN56_00310, partial [Clostridia bacterium]|nr:hypothetical protein [Clostridia bacterium]
NAFVKSCNNLTVDIPDSVNLKSIGENAFFNTANYNEWKSGDESNDFVIGNYLITARETITAEDNGT